MISKAIDIFNRTRDQDTPVLNKKKLAEYLIEKGLVTSYQYAIMLFRNLDEKKQNKMTFDMLLALSEFFKVSINELIRYYKK